VHRDHIGGDVSRSSSCKINFCEGFVKMYTAGQTFTNCFELRYRMSRPNGYPHTDENFHFCRCNASFDWLIRSRLIPDCVFLYIFNVFLMSNVSMATVQSRYYDSENKSRLPEINRFCMRLTVDIAIQTKFSIWKVFICLEHSEFFESRNVAN